VEYLIRDGIIKNMARNIKNFFIGKRKKRNWNNEINPDEIFLDSSNLPNFDVYQFEGRFEKPITKKTIILLGFFFILTGCAFIARVGVLQILKGDALSAQSENNRLRHTPVFSERGVIYDKNGVELAWNSPGQDDFSLRSYIDIHGLAHLLGFVSYPASDNKGIYYRKELVGKDGAERFYNKKLMGENGIKIVETNALMEVQSESVIKPPVNGENITLSIDVRVQNKLFEFMKQLSADHGFSGGAGVILDVKNGEILALASFPEYDPTILSNGGDASAIRRWRQDTRKPFLNRVVSGLYTPGSVIKPFVAIGALNEKVITPDKKILSTGSISIPNPYFPNTKSVFTDWKAHGWVDIKEALAVSSNVYFYEVGGGFEDQKGIGIANIEKYTKLFGLGELTGIDLLGEKKGVIPNPEWKAKNFNGEKWRVGDTYNTTIGQYGFQVTPIQMVRAIAAIANEGKLVSPHITKGIVKDFMQINGVDKNYFTIVKEGMRKAVTQGTAKGLNIPQVKIAAKTGTAEVGISKKRVNAWIVGFFPYKNPRFAFTVVMEKGPRKNTIGGLFVMRQLLEWMAINTPEYLKN
jgi:penicillin-binding protein 2